jgi:predicted DCC family thiol-disulfide oxidoreductase YuxK
MTDSTSSSPPAMRVLYDGECPFCANYVAMARLRERVGEVELIDARTRPDLVAAHKEAGRPIDEGMIVETPDAVYFGGDAVWAINALLSTNPVLNALSGRAMLKFVYPALRFGRNTVLRIMGRKPIDPERARL